MTAHVPRRTTGRCANGAERDGGRLFHAVPPGSEWDAAACGAKPGRLSAGWSATLGPAVTCKRCLAVLATPTHLPAAFHGPRQKCRVCPHPAHLGTCTGRSGGTAYTCGCHHSVAPG